LAGENAAVEVKGIHRNRVTEWFAAHIGGVTPPLEFELIAGGHSNLTYKLTDAAGGLYVLRRPPLGAVLATAHDMAREHRIISAIGRTEVPVPPALGLCEDEDVNDAPFYVMEYVEGHVLVDGASTERLFGAEERYRIGHSVIQVLADLHRLDPDEIGLGDLGRREAYLARQLKRWRTQWEKTKTRELAAMEEVHQALQAQMPEQIGVSVVHGDYRLGNMLVGRDARVAAVLDWELCTLGDPMADVGYVMNNWAQPAEGSATMRGASLAPTMAGGFPDREAFLERYVELTGRDVRRVDYYRAFQYWRLAAIVEGVLARYLKGVMGNAADTEAFRLQVDSLAEEALALVRRLG
jgi:aminoglycoside phosphotransferase (APT) family kinase protein